MAKLHLPRTGNHRSYCGSTKNPDYIVPLSKFTLSPPVLRCSRCERAYVAWVNAQEPIHATEVKSYLACRQAWGWSASRPRGHYLESKYSVQPFSIGRIMHSALASHYDTGDKVGDIFNTLADIFLMSGTFFSEEDMAETEEVLVKLSVVLSHYEEWEQDTSQLKVIATELKVRSTFGDDNLPVVCRFDALVTDQDNDIWVLDFKSSSRFRTGWVNRDLQAIIYTAVARKVYGERVKGMVFRFIMKSKPKTWEQLILKSGKVTQAKASLSRTTYWDLKEAIVVAVIASELGVLPRDAHVVLVEAQAGNEHSKRIVDLMMVDHISPALSMYYQPLNTLKAANPYIFDEVVPIDDVMVQATLSGVVVPAMQEMFSAPTHAPTGLGTAWAQCGRCVFKDPCMLRLEGKEEEVNDLIAARFVSREDQQEYAE